MHLCSTRARAWFGRSPMNRAIGPAIAAMLIALAMLTGVHAADAGSQAGAPAVEPGFTSLFNGKDFAGWKIGGPAASFTIQEGAIVANGAPSHAYYDGSFRNHSFRNFELKADIMTRAGSNGGVYVLTEFQEVGGNT